MSNYCSNRSRPEERVSQFALCYNATHDSNEMAKKMMISNKEKKSQSYKSNEKLRARGKLKFLSSLSLVKARHEKIEAALIRNPNLVSTFKKITTASTCSSAGSFKQERQEKEFQKVNQPSTRVRQPNQLMRARGVDYTHYIANEVQFSAATKKNYEAGINAELIIRGFPEDQLGSFQNYNTKKRQLRNMVAMEKKMDDPKDVKSFAIKSSFDWTPIFNQNRD